MSDSSIAKRLLAIANKYIDEAVDEESACEAWMTNRKWTILATSSLRRAALEQFPDAEVACKGHRDTEGQAEYMTLDLCLWDPHNPWGPPLLIAEFENKLSPDSVAFSAWKLLVFSSPIRILVAYYGLGCEFKTLAQLKAAIQKVCDANPGRPLALIAAAACDAHTAHQIRAHHQKLILMNGNPRRQSQTTVLS